MRIAIVGAGIFGGTVAIKLAEAGFTVDLFEKESDILQAASGINQYRLHRGYHYPRSKETALSSKRAEESFRRDYGEAVIDQHEHYYCIAKEKSRVSGADFLKFCYDCELEHEKAELPHVKNHLIDFTVRGKEAVIDPNKLRQIAREKILKNKINLLLNQVFGHNQIDDYDAVINCAYANLNSIFENLPEAKRNYQFELCEKMVLRLPEKFKNKSIVVLDGPFFCIDPYSDTGFHVMGNVVHAIHATNVGHFPHIPEEFRPLMNRGIVKNPQITNVAKLLESAAYFMPEIRKAEHVGSMYTIRTVLPDVDHTDERPTLVTRVNDKIINVFSGKIGNCVEAAEEVLNLVKESARTF
ncbi:MAG: FAD-dependent oxidoreductase [Patescibacteria group bacterium]